MEIVPLPARPEVVPARSPGSDTHEPSSCTISSEGGPGVTIWSVPGVRRSPETGCEVRLQLSPDAWETTQATKAEWNGLCELLIDEVTASRAMQELLTTTRLSTRKKYHIHRPLRLQ